MKVEDLKNTKIYLSNEEDRIKFQEKVFRLGVEWSDGSNSVYKSMFSDAFFTINEFLNLFIVRCNISFISKKRKQIFLEDVLAIEEPKKECKFKPYDKVLVRDYDNERWIPRLFAWHNVGYKEDYPCPFETTDGDFYSYCIPYDENLANTAKSKD